MENKRIAIYPGTFDPFTIGHLNILEKAEALFGKENVIIAVGENSSKDKANTAFLRMQNIQSNIPSKKVEKYQGFLTDFVWEKEKLGYDVTIIRGLRDSDDLGYERTQLKFMQEMKPELKVVFILCDKEFEHVSSSAYRALEAVRPGAGHKYLAKEVAYFYVVDTGSSYLIENDTLQNKINLCTKVKVFRGTEFEVVSWVHSNPWFKFNPNDYTIGTAISYDREIMTLVYINEHRCVLKYNDSEIKLERYSAPYIWIKYRKL